RVLPERLPRQPERGAAVQPDEHVVRRDPAARLVRPTQPAEGGPGQPGLLSLPGTATGHWSRAPRLCLVAPALRQCLARTRGRRLRLECVGPFRAPGRLAFRSFWPVTEIARHKY